MDSPFSFMLPQPSKQRQVISFEWVTVFSLDPLQVIRDNDSGPLNVTPASIVAGLEVDDRVLLLHKDTTIIVLGRAEQN